MVLELKTELKTVHELTNNTEISQPSKSTPMKKMTCSKAINDFERKNKSA